MLEGKKTQVNSLTNPTHRLIACTVVQHAVTAAPGPALWPRPFTCGVTCTSRVCSHCVPWPRPLAPPLYLWRHMYFKRVLPLASIPERNTEEALI